MEGKVTVSKRNNGEKTQESIVYVIDGLETQRNENHLGINKECMTMDSFNGSLSLLHNHVNEKTRKFQKILGLSKFPCP